MSQITLHSVDFSYESGTRAANGPPALDQINLSISKGDFIAILGRNGSGKSTLVKLFNALLLPANGTVCIRGIDTGNESQLWEIRRMSGMIFQDPDSQIIGTTVAEDIAFGPENLGLPPLVIQSRVQDALQAVGMAEYADSAAHLLSSAQKLRVSLAGVMAMQPECILLDEADAMLDPTDRKELMSLLRSYSRERGITVVHVTHDMEEAERADRVIVLDGGQVILDGPPAVMFSHVSALKGAGLDLPQVTDLLYRLNLEGFDLPADMTGTDEALEILGALYAGRKQRDVHQN
jgi:energy-coupling factor transport system ATP-binding protein